MGNLKMKYISSNVIRVFNCILGSFLLLAGLIFFTQVFTQNGFDYCGFTMVCTFTSLGSYLIASACFQYYGGFQTLAGILFIGFSAFGLTSDFEDNAFTSTSIIMFLIFCSTGLSFLWWGKKRHEKT